MPSSRSHRFAAGVLLLGGGLVAVFALAIVVAHAVIVAGVPGIVATPQDVALLGDLFAVLPFIATFAAANLVVGIGLALGIRWAPRIARWITAVTVGVGLVGLVLMIAANGPVSATEVAGAADPDGFAIVSGFVCLYAWAGLAVRLPEHPRRPLLAGAAA